MVSKKALASFSIVSFLVFIYFSYLVAHQRFTQLDFDLTVKFQDHISRSWDLPLSIFSLLGTAEITILVWLGLVILSLLKRFFLTLLALSLFIAGAAVEIFGKLFVYHPSPPFFFYRGTLGFNFPSHYIHTDYSYPSGHMTRTTFLIIFLILWLYLRVSPTKRFLPQLGLLSFLAIMMVSRIYLGEHWTSDVVGGMLLGGSLGSLVAVTIPQTER